MWTAIVPKYKSRNGRASGVSPGGAPTQAPTAGTRSDISLNSGQCLATIETNRPTIPAEMDTASVNGNSAHLYSADGHAKLSQHSPIVDDHDVWSGDGSSGDEANRSQSGTSKRKRPLSVSCEICKQRKAS